MAYLTESKLANVIDLPVSVPATEVKQGDWIVLATTKIIAPMLMTVRYMSLQTLSCSVDVSRISSTNRISGSLGLVYLVLRKDYVSGNPGVSGAIDSLVATDLGIYQRNTNSPILVSAAGVYSWILVNNMKADATSAVPPSTSIDFRICVTGQLRLDLSNT